ncbi:hypothetical protein [Rhizobium leguminosarum]|uniref:hypothetical protein n=1 Tax=Rhizobium leguminosarum TaxID=384 RepID=UPI002FF01C66
MSDQPHDPFWHLHDGLTVSMIMTHRDDLLTCTRQDTVASVMARNDGPYSFLPVKEDGKFIGLFEARKFFSGPDNQAFVVEHFSPISESFLIGIDTPIQDFVMTADDHPCRLVVSKKGVAGLVTISDIQKLPVRAALFAMITGLEMEMISAIRASFQSDADWLRLLSPDRVDDLNDRARKAKAGDTWVDVLLFTQFSDKTTIIRKSKLLGDIVSARKLGMIFDGIRNLRDNVAHANSIAETEAQEMIVSRTVRDIANYRTLIRDAVHRFAKRQ